MSSHWWRLFILFLHLSLHPALCWLDFRHFNAEDFQQGFLYFNVAEMLACFGTELCNSVSNALQINAFKMSSHPHPPNGCFCFWPQGVKVVQHTSCWLLAVLLVEDSRVVSDVPCSLWFMFDSAGVVTGQVNVRYVCVAEKSRYSQHVLNLNTGESDLKVCCVRVIHEI